MLDSACEALGGGGGVSRSCTESYIALYSSFMKVVKHDQCLHVLLCFCGCCQSHREAVPSAGCMHTNPTWQASSPEKK